MSSDELGRLVGIPVFIANDEISIAREVAGRIADVIERRAAAGRKAVLGLATGSTPRDTYRELVGLHREEGLDWSTVVTFNLDEYFPMDPTHEQSYHRYMREHLFDHVNVPREQIHIPRGDIPREEVERHCAEYEDLIRDAGGIDLLLLGIGRDGHVGFNEPGSERASRTRLVELDPVTRADAADDFGGEAHVPRYAITMGVATIMEAREIVLIALGGHKTDIVRRAVEGPPRAEVVATYLQEHPSAEMILDPPAADALALRFRERGIPGERAE